MRPLVDSKVHEREGAQNLRAVDGNNLTVFFYLVKDEGLNSVEPVVNARFLGVDGTPRGRVQSQEWFAHVPVRVVVQVRAFLVQAFEGFSLRAARLADERMRATRERVERDIQARFDAVRERAERGARDYFGLNYSEFPNSSRRRDASRRWDDSRGDVSPGNKPIVFMAEDEMVELASSPGLSYKDQNSLAVFGGERVHMALAGRDDLCDDAQMALVVHGDGRAQVALARRRSLSESVQVALAVHGDFAARRALSRRFDLCDHARRVLS